jgi:hypothetical protein
MKNFTITGSLNYSYKIDADTAEDAMDKFRKMIVPNGPDG